MIQVIARTFAMLAVIGKSDGARLTDLAAAAGIGKTTAGNILTTLKKLGYLSQNERSEYLLSDQFHALSASKVLRDRVAAAAEENVRFLAGRVNESVVLATLVNGERHTVAEARADRALTVNTDVYRDGNLLSTITGRVLLAIQPAKDRSLRKIRIDSALAEELAAIREKGIGYLVKNDITAVGVPIIAGEFRAAIGIYLPSMRFTGKHKADIIESLTASAKRMEIELSSASQPRPNAAA